MDYDFLSQVSFQTPNDWDSLRLCQSLRSGLWYFCGLFDTRRGAQRRSAAIASQWRQRCLPPVKQEGVLNATRREADPQTTTRRCVCECVCVCFFLRHSHLTHGVLAHRGSLEQTSVSSECDARWSIKGGKAKTDTHLLSFPSTRYWTHSIPPSKPTQPPVFFSQTHTPTHIRSNTEISIPFISEELNTEKT